jgi:hypothetical protein
VGSTTIKATYALDPETTKALEEMARRWSVSKSEALRRAIRAAAERDRSAPDDGIRALDRLQKSLALTVDRARRWETSARVERGSSSRRLERRRR